MSVPLRSGALPAEGLRERKKRETRGRLYLAALRLAAERGVGGVTVEEIADAAQVSPRTFFNYYPSKEAAVVGASADLPERLAAAVVARPQNEAPLAALAAVLRAHLAALDADPQMRLMRTAVMRASPELLATAVGSGLGVERAVAEAVAMRLGVPPGADPYPLLVTAAAFGALRAAMSTAELSASALTRSLDRCFEHLGAGLG